MPSFNKLRRLEFDCLIVPPWGIRNFCAFIQRYERKKQYRILFPYFDGADIEFLISIYDKMDDFEFSELYKAVSQVIIEVCHITEKQIEDNIKLFL